MSSQLTDRKTQRKATINTLKLTLKALPVMRQRSDELEGIIQKNNTKLARWDSKTGLSEASDSPTLREES